MPAHLFSSRICFCCVQPYHPELLGFSADWLEVAGVFFNLSLSLIIFFYKLRCSCFIHPQFWFLSSLDEARSSCFPTFCLPYCQVSLPFHSLSFSFPFLPFPSPLLCFQWSWVYNSSLLQNFIGPTKDIRTPFPHCFEYCNNSDLLNLYIAVVKSVYCHQRHQPVSLAFPERRWRAKIKGITNNDFWWLWSRQSTKLNLLLIPCNPDRNFWSWFWKHLGAA